ncbi:MAG: SAM-dependent methyltransferase [Myxococcales bacterium]
MREDTPSVTAMFVAYARAVGTHEPELSRACQDPIAERIVPKPWSNVLRAARLAPRAPQRFRDLRRLTLGLIDHLALRTGVIDRALRSALASGVRQVVLLGAGLDARAHRIQDLRDATVFEVDHPSTQTLKIRKAAGLPVLAKDLRYAPCDFEKVSLEQALLAQGFEPGQPSIWIWEGVTMYLDESAVEGSLERIARLSAPGSTVIATYVTPKIIASGSVLGHFGLAALAVISEPVRSSSTPPEMARRFAHHGFEVSFDQLPADVAADFAVTHPLRWWGMPDEHVLVARKPSR